MINDITDQLPPPEIVARAAAVAPAPRVLEDYIEAIRILRDKKFTFREIAEWLGKEFNIEADHNSVWRAYTKYMDDYSSHLEAAADEELERDEAIAEAEAKGTFIVHNSMPTAVSESKPAKVATVEKENKKKRPKKK